MIGIRGLIKSKKFWSALGALVAVVSNELLGLGIDPELFVGLGAILVGGYAAQDVAKELGKGKEADAA